MRSEEVRVFQGEVVSRTYYADLGEAGPEDLLGAAPVA
jgi:hypothetical protein